MESYKVKKQGELGLLRNQQCQLGLRDQKRFPDHQQVANDLWAVIVHLTPISLLPHTGAFPLESKESVLNE